jgi:hypothetical protein
MISELTKIGLGLLDRVLVDVEPEIEEWLINELKISANHIQYYLAEKMGESK